MNIGPKCTTPISKLYGISRDVRFTLKLHSITTSYQLLEAAAKYEDRLAFAVRARLRFEALTAVIQRADIARINGIGTSFARMLADVGVPDVTSVAAQDARTLQHRLHVFNQAERMVRRCPTLDEIVDWIAQARGLPAIVTYAPRADETVILGVPATGAGAPSSAPRGELSS